MTKEYALSRRSFLAATTAATTIPIVARSRDSTPSATTDSFTWPDPVDIGEGFQILDWRLFPNDDLMRFIAEVRNTTDSIVPAPVVGVIIPSLPESEDYAWGAPFTPVVYPGESTFVVGVAPAALSSDDQWGEPEWVYCAPSDTDTDMLMDIDELEFEMTTEVEVHEPSWMQCNVSLANKGEMPISSMEAPGIVRDGSGRICGAVPTSNINELESGESIDFVTNVRPGVPMIVNPFHLVDDLTGGSAQFSLQPRSGAILPGCPAIMPWNR